MHEHFANWYRLVTIEPRAETLEKRWQAIEAFTENITKDESLELVRLFFQIPPKNTETVNRFKNTFKTEDSAFLTKDNELELQVLAASSIMHILSATSYSGGAVSTALGVCIAVCQKLRKRVVLPDALESAYKYLLDESIRVRAVKPVTVTKVTAKDIEKPLSELKTAIDAGTSIKDPILSVIKKLQHTQNEFINATQNNLDTLQKAYKVQAEESNIQWWLYSEFSRDLEVPFKSLTPAAACLIFAKELGDLTAYFPLLRSAEGFLSKALCSTMSENLPESIDIPTAVSLVPNEMKEQWLEPSCIEIVEDLCPVYFVLSRSAKSTKTSDWSAQFEKQFGFKHKQSLSPVALAMQFYREQMLKNLFK